MNREPTKEEIKRFWEDTILDDDEKLTCASVSKCPLSDIKDVIDETCLHQAQATYLIAFEAGEKSGIIKVVEFFKEWMWFEDDKTAGIKGSSNKFYKAWEVKLKEWGIEQ